jgi:hypothetical protein
VVEQIIRPTGLVDPEVEVRPVRGQVDDLLAEIRRCEANNERVLVTTLTKRMAEDLTDYLQQAGVRVRYMHSDIDTIERMEIVRGLRLGEFDVLVGINLLREGLDLPEVALVAILDADQEGFLRSDRSLIQTVGRAARNVGGRGVLYADRVTGSMERALSEMNRRRSLQEEHNREHGITPASIRKSVDQVRLVTRVADARAPRPEAAPKAGEGLDRRACWRFSSSRCGRPQPSWTSSWPRNCGTGCSSCGPKPIRSATLPGAQCERGGAPGAGMAESVTLAELRATAARLWQELGPGSVVWLTGELGSGKTTFVQAVADAAEAEPARSPSFALVHEYPSPHGPLVHVDCYRLREPAEALDLDFPGLERRALAPPPDTHLHLAHAEDPERRVLERVA